MEETMKEYSMKWYKFIIYVHLFFTALRSIGSAYVFFSGSLYQGNANAVYAAFSGMKTLDMLMGIINIGIAVFCIIVRQKLANFKKEGPDWYLTLIGLSLATSIMYIGMASIITGINLMNSSIVPSIVEIIVLLVANRIYFDNRKELFVN